MKKSLVIVVFLLVIMSVSGKSAEVTPYYGLAMSDSGEMTLDRGVVESSSEASTFFGLQFGPEYLDGSVGIDFFYHSTTQAFLDTSSDTTVKKDLLGTYINLYLAYGFLSKGNGQYWLRAYVAYPFFGSLKPLESDEDHFFSPTGLSLGLGVNVYKNIYVNLRYQMTEYEKYFTNGAAVSNLRENLKTNQLFSFISFKF